MVKVLKRYRLHSDMAQNSRSLFRQKKNNPFEVHQNREKFQILGRQNKHSRGFPGISREKAINKRKEILGKEFKTKNKVNKFLDRRIGADLANETSNIRFSELQQNKLKNKIFNSNIVVLTHKGKTIEAANLKFRDERSDESEIDESLNENFTKMTNFGGGKAFGNTDRKTSIENIIIENKRRKIQVLNDKANVFQMTIQLDEKYKMLLPHLGMLNANNLQNKSQVDEYDTLMRKMIFEPRGEVSDRLKTKETVKLEKKKNETLKHERLARVKGNENYKPKHISIDDLEDGYYVESNEDMNKNRLLGYDINENMKLEYLKNSETEESEIGTEEESEEKLSIVLNQNEATNTIHRTNSTQYFKFINNEIQINCQLTSTFENFLTLLQGKNPKIQGYVVQKLMENNHPKIRESNRRKIVQLFEYILRFLTLEFGNLDNIKRSFRILDQILPYLFEMIKIDSKETTECFLEIIKKHFELYKRNIEKVPNIETIFVFKIISNLYSTSDFDHPIVTPSVIFINKILTESYFETRKEISLGFFLVTLLLEFTNFSKRFLPACFNFLLGILTLAISKNSVEGLNIAQPFKCASEISQSSILLLLENNSSNFEKKLTASDLISNKNIDNSFKISSLNTMFKLLIEYANMTDSGCLYILEQFLRLMERLNLENYPDFVKQNYAQAKRNLILILNNKLSRLIAPESKPKFLRLLEPKVEKISDVRRRPKVSEEKRIRAIMIHKVKRESKGAVREIRRDTQFLNKIKIKHQIQSDLERKEKVRKIFAEASTQQGELNALKRQRDKAKF